jgi:type I restriction enzyme S subunit
MDQANIQELRQAILQEAVSGRLVPQDPNDEPASELLRKVRSEKEELIKEKKIKRDKPLPPITKEEIPYDLPKGWEWVRLGEIRHDWGQKIPDKKFTYIDVSSINKEKGFVENLSQQILPQDAPSRARKIVRKGTVIYSCVRPYLLNTSIITDNIEPEPITSTAFAILHPLGGIDPEYLHYFLRSQVMIDFVNSKMVGIAYPAISDSDFYKGLFPLPPLSEQRRIVEKVDQLIQTCDELETKVKENQKYSEDLMNAISKEAFEFS